MWALFTWILFYVGLPVGLAYLGGILFGPDVPESKADEGGSKYRIWNPLTKQQEGIARPRAYGLNMHHGNIVAQWTEVSSDKEILYLILEHGDGPTGGIGANKVYLNDQPSTNFRGISIIERLGTMDQTVMPGFEKTKLEYNLNIELLQDDPSTYFTTPNDFFDDIEYTIAFPNGLRGYDKDGDMISQFVHFYIDVQEIGGGWTEIFDDAIIDTQIEAKFKRYKVSNQGFACERGKQYELKFNRSTADGRGRTVDNTYLRSIREVVDVAFTRPGKALVGIKAVATSKLSGSLDVKVVRQDRIINVYDGTSWTLEYSNNRAWVVWDILTQPIIAGNGGGVPYSIDRYEGIDPSYLDLVFFYAWAQFCDEEILDGYGGTEPRCACNLIIEEFTDAYTLAQDIAAAGRAHIYWDGHILTGWIDDVVTDPIDLVTMDNIIDGSWKNSWVVASELAGVVEVMYSDAMQGYERTSAEFCSEDAGGYRNIVTVEGVGITTRGPAIHLAHYLLERNHLIRNINKFRIHKDAFRYKLGHVIRLQSRPANWGHAFRVVSSTADTITVDRNAESEITAGDVIHIRSWNTITESVVTDTYAVQSVLADVITATASWDVTPLKDNLVAVGAAGDIKLRRIIGIEPTMENFFDVTVETYDVELFDSDTVDPGNPNANYIWPGPASGTTGPITRAEMSDLVSQIMPPQPDIEIPWPSNLTFTGDDIDTVSWSATDGDYPITFRYRGTTYEITADDTTDEFIYWDPNFTTTFQTTNLITTATASGMWYMCRNIDGVAYPVNAMVGANIGVILAGYLRVGTADIDDLAVTTGKIKDLNVTTLKIEGNAVTVPTGNYTSTATNHTDTNWHTAQTISFTTHGAPVLLIFSLCYYVSEDAEVDIRIQLDNTSTVYSTRLCGEPASGQGVYRSFAATVIHTPAGGAHTYDLDISCYDPGYTGFVYYKNRSLVGMEIRK